MEPIIRFARPPVVETVLGVQFSPLPAFKNAYLGVYWRSLGCEWPKVTDAPPLASEYERFGTANKWEENSIQLRISQEVSSRLQIKNAAGDRMIQAQNGRFVYNWLGHQGAAYPSYSKIRPEFDFRFQQFAAFLKQESLGELAPDQWEVTYVNHIPQGSLWSDPSDWPAIFPTLLAKPNSPSAKFESLSGQWHFALDEKRGRLHIQVGHGRRPSDDTELLVVTLTARGPVTRDFNLESGFNLGRKTIVIAFSELASSLAAKQWGVGQ